MTLIALWWLAPSKTNAQQDSTATRVLEEVVITATKFPKSQSETGKVLTVIDREQLAQSTGKDLAQVLNDQVGLFVNGANSTPGKDKAVYLRGAKSEYTLVLLDGVPLNDPSGLGGGAYDLRLLPISQIERIEILKGSQSTLYGSDAIAGVINIITKTGGASLTGDATLSYGSFNTLRGSASVSGSVPHLKYTAGFSHHSSDGVSEAYDQLKVGGFDKDGFAQDAFHTGLTIDVDPKLSIRPHLRYTALTGDYDGGNFVDDTQNNYRYRLINTGVSSTYKMNKGVLNFQYSFNNTQRTFDGTYGKSKYAGNFHHGELYANYDLTKSFQLLPGLAIQSWQMMDTTSTERNPTIHLISPYLSFFMKPLQGLSIELGARANFHSQYGQNFTYSLNPSYQLHKQVKVFTNVSTGYKAPTLYQLYGAFGANPNLTPEKSQSLEAGFQLSSRSGKADLRVVGFQRAINDVIFYSYPQGYTNQDKQRDEGFEVESFHSLSKEVSLNLFYGFVEGYVLTPALGNEKTNNLFRRPKNSFGIQLTAQISSQLSIGLQAKTFGKRKDLYFSMETFQQEVVDMKAYQLVDLHVAFATKNKRVQFFADARNLLNQNYFEVYGYSTLPFNISAGISCHLEK